MLDAALQLGFGTNRSIANMIFDVVDEDDEEVRSSIFLYIFRFSVHRLDDILFLHLHLLVRLTDRSL